MEIYFGNALIQGCYSMLKMEKNVLKWNDVRGQEHKCDKLKTKKPNSNKKKRPFLQKNKK